MNKWHLVKGGYPKEGILYLVRNDRAYHQLFYAKYHETDKVFTLISHDTRHGECLEVTEFMGISLLPSITEPEWISIRNSYPKPGEKYLATDGEQIQIMAYFGYDKWPDDWSSYTNNTIDVTHWMKLPKLPSK